MEILGKANVQAVCTAALVSGSLWDAIPIYFPLLARLVHPNPTTVIREQGSWIKIPCNHNEPLTAMIRCRCLDSWDSLGEP